MASPGMWQSPIRLYTNKSKAFLVPEDSPLAAFVVCAEGGEILLRDAERYEVADLTKAADVLAVVNRHALQPAQAPEPPPLAPEPVDGTTGSGTPPDEEDVKTKAQRKPADKAVHGPVEDK